MSSSLIPGLNQDTMKFILTWIRGGSWHTVCRLCCRAWAHFLTPVPLQRPFGPFEEALLACNLHTLQWLFAQGVPWSCEAALSACTFQGRLDALRWTVQHAPVCVRSLTYNDRFRITRNLIRAAPHHLEAWHAAIKEDPVVAAIFGWSTAMLVFAVRLHGSGAFYHADLWRTYLERCMGLCGGWAVQALHAAIRYAELDVVQFLMLHPTADPTVVWGNSYTFSVALYNCAMRKQRDGPRMWELVIGLAPDGMELPWSALEAAVHECQLWFVRAFLADPRCPGQRSGPGPDGVAVAVVRLSKPDAVVIELLHAIAAAGIDWDTEEVLEAVLDRPKKHTLLQWMLQNGRGGQWNLFRPDMVLLRCILVGCAWNLRALLPHVSATIDKSDPVYTTSAAEMGSLDVLQCLREWEYQWDHQCLQMALTNNHLEVAKWALTQGCPILTRPIAPGTGDEEQLRATLMGVL